MSIKRNKKAIVRINKKVARLQAKLHAAGTNRRRLVLKRRIVFYEDLVRFHRMNIQLEERLDEIRVQLDRRVD